MLILLAACLVSGILFLLVNGAGGQPGLLSSLYRRGGLNGGFRLGGRQAVLTDLGALLIQGMANLGLRSNFLGGGFRDRFFQWRGLANVAGDLVVVALIVMLVVVLHRAFKHGLSRSRSRFF